MINPIGRLVCVFDEPVPRVGTVVGDARAAGALVVRWKHSDGCSVICRSRLAFEGSPLWTNAFGLRLLPSPSRRHKAEPLT